MHRGAAVSAIPGTVRTRKATIDDVAINLGKGSTAEDDSARRPLPGTIEPRAPPAIALHVLTHRGARAIAPAAPIPPSCSAATMTLARAFMSRATSPLR